MSDSEALRDAAAVGPAMVGPEAPPAVDAPAGEEPMSEAPAVEPAAIAASAAEPSAPLDDSALDDAALDRLFRTARTHGRWRPEEIEDDVLRRLYDLLRLGPTSANTSPARFVFLRSPEARARLRPALSPGNIASAMTAPVVVIVAHDPHFHDHLPMLYPQAEARSWFANDAEFAEVTAFRNGTLQGAYLILAARALGLDCGPMSGFDQAKVDAEFTAGFGWKSNFLVALGHAEGGDLPPRAPRLDFDTACHLL